MLSGATNGGWRVRVEGTILARSIYKTQAEAAKTGRAIARQYQSERAFAWVSRRLR